MTHLATTTHSQVILRMRNRRAMSRLRRTQEQRWQVNSDLVPWGSPKMVLTHPNQVSRRDPSLLLKTLRLQKRRTQLRQNLPQS